MDSNPPGNRSQAYWNLGGVPSEFLAAIGAVSVRWGQYEMFFDAGIGILSRSPETAELVAKKRRSSFKQRTELFRKLAAICFPDSPSFCEKLGEHSKHAYEVCQKRNLLIHGFWYNSPNIDPSLGITLTSESDGTGDFYAITLKEIEALSIKISNLRSAHFELLYSTPEVPPALTQTEVSVREDYYRRYPAPKPDGPPKREPHRVGSPLEPVPFQA